MAYQEREKVKFPIQFGGYSPAKGEPVQYPGASEAKNIRFRKDGGFEKGPGMDLWNKGAGTGKVAVTAGSKAIVGTGTAFDTEFAVNDIIYVTDTKEARHVLTITDATHATASQNFSTTDTSSDFTIAKIEPATQTHITGLFQLRKSDASTRYQIACTLDTIYSVPTSGTWTALVSSISGPTEATRWSATVFNNEMILTHPLAGPYVTGGTAATSGLLVRTTYMQAMTAMGTARAGYGQLHNINGRLYSAGGDTGDGNPAAETYCNAHEAYDTVGNTWTALIPPLNIGRTQHAGFVAYDREYICCGLSAAGTFSTYAEHFSPVANAWTSVAQVSGISKRMVSAVGINNVGHVVYGNNDHTNATTDDSTLTNHAYDPATNTWTAKASDNLARRQACGFNIGHMGYFAGGATAAAPLTSARKYDPFSNTYSALGAIGTARKDAGGTGSKNGYGYIMGGDSGEQPTETVLNSLEKYDPIANTFSAVSTAVLATAKTAVACGNEGYWVYAAGGMSGATAATPNGQMDRLNTSPSPPQAYYCTSHKGHVFLARSSTYPSRVWYSEPGDATQWPSYNWFDINPDDGDWITAIFVWDNKLYVSKREKIYQITGEIFDPSEGDFSYYPLTGTVGAIEQNAVCITDTAVYFIGRRGAFAFDGNKTTCVSEDLTRSDITSDLFGTGHMTNACSVWDRDDDEVWFNLYSTELTSGVLYVYNYGVNKWSRVLDVYGLGTYSYGHDLGPMAIFQDSTNNDDIVIVLNGNYAIAQITGDIMLGNQYWSAVPTTLSTTASWLTTGRFFPAGPGKFVSGAHIDVYADLTSAAYSLFGTVTSSSGGSQAFSYSNFTADAGSASSGYYRIPIDETGTGEWFALKMGTGYASASFKIYAAVFVGHVAQAKSTP